MAGTAAVKLDATDGLPAPKPVSPFLADLRISLEFDTEFAEEFKILKPYLARISRKWPYALTHRLQADKRFSASLTDADYLEFNRLTARLTIEMRSGRFYEDYESAVRNAGDFLVSRGVSPSFLVGGFVAVFHEAQLELYFDRHSEEGRIVVSALRCLLKIMTLTLQILDHLEEPGTPIEEAGDLAPASLE